ncbi:MAG TPA: ABC transporter ATP-binding protein [Acidimicrobiales bacterium]|nr:ABC transporter ATP-binding protein [Acidimicrobiales bacterium]
MTSSLLSVRDLTVHHGQLCAVRDFSLDVAEGEVVAIIGANGAGKSTLLRTMAGLHSQTSGSIALGGKDLGKLRPDQRLAEGLALVPEGRRLFPSLTVEENLRVGTHRARSGPFDIEKVYETFPWMLERRRQPAALLSGGEQQAVAVGRALVANPRVLLFDELSLGLSPIAAKTIYSILPKLVDGGMTIVIVEQDLGLALQAASRVQCLLEGRVVLEGEASGLDRVAIEAAYFGVGTRAGTSL